MTTGMGLSRLLAIIALLCVMVLAWAWVDGGREPVRDIVQPVAVPEVPR